MERFCTYRKAKGVSKKSINDYRDMSYKVLSMVDKPLNRWTREDAIHVYSSIYIMPPYTGTKPEFKNISMIEIIKLAEQGGYERISIETANNYFRAFKAFFKWAMSSGYVKNDIFLGIEVRPNKKKPNKQRDIFSNEQLSEIFGMRIFNSKSQSASFKYWIPIIGLEMAMRQGEIAQLNCSDIRQEDGIWFISVSSNTEDQKVKNPSSIRDLPITSNLIRLGFLDFVKDRGQGKLFSDVRYSEINGYGDIVSKWFSHEKKQLGYSRENTFHSLRHNAIDRMKKYEINEALAAEISGHSYRSETYSRYGKSYHLKVKRNILNKISHKVIKRLPRVYGNIGIKHKVSNTIRKLI